MIRLPLALLLGVIASGAEAQMVLPVTVCLERPDMLNQLQDRHHEAVITRGIAGSNLVEWLASPDGSWTVLLTTVHGKTCILSSGGHFEWFAPKGAPS